MKKYLTYQELKEMEACTESLISFRSIFGKVASIEQVVHRLQNPGKRDKHAEEYEEWFAWLMAQTQELTITLLEKGVDVRARDNFALCWAAKYGHTEIVKILLKAGSDVRARDNFALCWAAKYGHTEIVKTLLKAGADVHAEDDFPLCRAVESGHTEIAKILKAEMKKKKK